MARKPNYAPIIQEEAPVAKQRYYNNQALGLQQAGLEQGAEQFNQNLALQKKQIEEAKNQANIGQTIAGAGLATELYPYAKEGVAGLYNMIAPAATSAGPAVAPASSAALTGAGTSAALPTTGVAAGSNPALSAGASGAGAESGFLAGGGGLAAGAGLLYDVAEGGPVSTGLQNLLGEGGVAGAIGSLFGRHSGPKIPLDPRIAEAVRAKGQYQPGSFLGAVANAADKDTKALTELFTPGNKF